MMRREYVRRPSRAARWALPPAVFAPVLAATAITGHWLDKLAVQNFVLVLVASLVLALIGAGLALLGLRALWRDAAIGGRRSGLALAFCAPVLIPAAAAAWLSQTTARLSDISTDTQDPPHFSVSLAGEPDLNVNEPPRLDAAQQKTFYPDVTGRRYGLSAEGIAAQAYAVVRENGWEALSTGPVVSTTGEWIIEASVTTSVLRFVDDVVIRVTDEGESAYVDMRSASRYGRQDLGANARRIVEFMNALNVRVQTGSAG
jgi:hypothetical protein